MVSPLSLLGGGRKKQGRSAGTLDTQVPLADEEVRATWATASWLIDYPDEKLLTRLPTLERLVAGLPERSRQGLESLTSALRTGRLRRRVCRYASGGHVAVCDVVRRPPRS